MNAELIEKILTVLVAVLAAWFTLKERIVKIELKEKELSERINKIEGEKADLANKLYKKLEELTESIHNLEIKLERQNRRDDERDIR